MKWDRATPLSALSSGPKPAGLNRDVGQCIHRHRHPALDREDRLPLRYAPLAVTSLSVTSVAEPRWWIRSLARIAPENRMTYRDHRRHSHKPTPTCNGRLCVRYLFSDGRESNGAAISCHTRTVSVSGARRPLGLVQTGSFNPGRGGTRETATQSATNSRGGCFANGADALPLRHA